MPPSATRMLNELPGSPAWTGKRAHVSAQSESSVKCAWSIPACTRSLLRRSERMYSLYSPMKTGTVPLTRPSRWRNRRRRREPAGKPGSRREHAHPCGACTCISKRWGARWKGGICPREGLSSFGSGPGVRRWPRLRCAVPWEHTGEDTGERPDLGAVGQAEPAPLAGLFHRSVQRVKVPGNARFTVRVTPSLPRNETVSTRKSDDSATAG